VSGTVSIEAHAADPESGVSKVRFLVQSISAGTTNTICTDFYFPYSCSWNTNNFPDGGYWVYAEATNGVGLTWSRYVRVSVANVGPTCDCLIWQSQGCGGAGCPSNTIGYTRSCTPPGCKNEHRCVPDVTCGACTDQCASGAKQCIDSTHYRTCGQYDTDTCLDWSSPIACPAGQTCLGESCSGAPSLSTPSISTNCVGNVSKATISWSGGDGSQGFWVDIDNDANWGNGFWNKNVSSRSAIAPDGFNPAFGTAGFLTLQGGKTYYTRVFDPKLNKHSPTANFPAKNCAPSVCTCDPVWTSHGCGGAGCPADKRGETRSCAPAGCQAEHRCVFDAACTVPTPTPATNLSQSSSCSASTVSVAFSWKPSPSSYEKQFLDVRKQGDSWPAYGNNVYGKNTITLLRYNVGIWYTLPFLQDTWYDWRIHTKISGTWYPSQTKTFKTANCASICNCTDWIDRGCDGAGCPSDKKRQTRYCSPSGCKSEQRCLSDPACDQPICNCGSWIDRGCGEGSCTSTQRLQTRSCDPSDCKPEERCISDTSCVPSPGGDLDVPRYIQRDYPNDEFFVKDPMTGTRALAYVSPFAIQTVPGCEVPHTIARAGCVAVSSAMIFDYYDKNMGVVNTANSFTDHGCVSIDEQMHLCQDPRRYSAGGGLPPGKCPSVFAEKGLTIVDLTGNISKVISDIAWYIDMGSPVFIGVAGPSLQEDCYSANHMMIAKGYRKDETGKVYKLLTNDPWGAWGVILESKFNCIKAAAGFIK